MPVLEKMGEGPGIGSASHYGWCLWNSKWRRDGGSIGWRRPRLLWSLRLGKDPECLRQSELSENPTSPRKGPITARLQWFQRHSWALWSTMHLVIGHHKWPMVQILAPPLISCVVLAKYCLSQSLICFSQSLILLICGMVVILIPPLSCGLNKIMNILLFFSEALDPSLHQMLPQNRGSKSILLLGLW